MEQVYPSECGRLGTTRPGLGASGQGCLWPQGRVPLLPHIRLHGFVFFLMSQTRHCQTGKTVKTPKAWKEGER